MLNFYPYPQALIVGLSMVSAFCAILQAVSLVFNMNRYQPGRTGRYESVLEAAVLLQVLLLSLLMAGVQNSIRDDLISASGYIVMRRLVFAAIAIPAGVVSLRRKILWPLLTALASVLTLPIMEDLAGSVFPALYGVALSFFCLRSIHVCILRRRELKTGISELSIKEAIDALHTGILFCEQDGRILLLNKRMQELMLALTGSVHKNGTAFFEILADKSSLQAPEEAGLAGSLIFRLTDGSVWMFSDTALFIRGKQYHQVSAADITERWSATAMLSEQNAELDRRSAELTETIANLKTIYREEEALRAKSHIHDVLGQRIAMLIRGLRENDRPDEALLRTFVQNLPADLQNLTAESNPAQELAAMTEMFAGIGVAVRLSGGLPEDRVLAGLLVDIVTESVTNAVRHGFATEVDIVCEKRDGLWRLTVKNSGVPPAGPIVEGSGIKAMRRRLLGLGGELELAALPRFVLTATLPEALPR